MKSTALALAVKAQTLVPLTVFDRVNGLFEDVTTTIKIAVGVGASIFILWLLFKREGMGRLVMGAAVAAIAVWLVAGGGIDSLSGDAGNTWENALPAATESVLELDEV